MFGSIGGAELILVLVLALLLFGPRKLPAIGRTLGAALSEFRKATLDFKTSLEREVELDELRSAKDALGSAGRELRETVEPWKRPRPGAARTPAAPGEQATAEPAAPLPRPAPRSAPQPTQKDVPPAPASTEREDAPDGERSPRGND
jgi:TatA/E family protein of Tat protein translocase